MKTRECSRCDAVETEAVEALGHTPGEPVIENNVEPTCTEAGSYDRIIYCSVCNEKISEEHVTVDALGHDWGAPDYVWDQDADPWTCTATAVCTRDSEHILT